MAYDGVAAADLAARLRAPACLSLVRVTSTLDIVHELAAEGAPAGTVVLADEQVAGRGRQGRSWYSPHGRGIWLGYLVRPRTPVGAGVLALRVGLAAADALHELGVEVTLKWPNDVLARDRKLAGILCESRWSGNRVQWIAVGIGMNVHGPLPDTLAASAVALDDVLPSVRRVTVLERLVPRLARFPDDPQLRPEERAAYERRHWLAGRRIVQPLPGRVRGIAGDGSLVVETDQGVRSVVGGHVVSA